MKGRSGGPTHRIRRPIQMSFDLTAERFDVDKAVASGNPINVVLAKGAELFNEVERLSNAYAVQTGDTCDAERAIIESSDDPEIVKAREKKAQLLAAIAKLDATLSAFATEKLSAELSVDGKSPEDTKKAHQTASAQLRDIVNPMRDMFAMMGLVTKHEEEGKRPTYTSNGSEEGDIFVKLLNAPGAVSSSKGTAANPGHGKRVREWWAANPEGLPEYQKQGKIPTVVKNAYNAANPSDAQENDGE